MDELTILRTFAAVTTVVAASLVAANMNARVTVAGFIIFIVASIAWMVDRCWKRRRRWSFRTDPPRVQRDLCGAGYQRPERKRRARIY